ncbi:Nif3-like dinuclear metal center hexameric protein [bacterium]|nr:Nif3-like dinuclear metal center hexameric protein [bacterium]MBU1884756.1 Nif3-like dinuclear metal center hexameric protein [bacterium]
MKTIDIYNYLNEISPFALQESWDNSGLLLGDLNEDVEKVYLSIDVDEKLIEEMDENSLLVTHHPLIFGGIKQLQFNQYPAHLIRKMVQKNISNIAMHTNFDQTHLNEYVATKILGLEIVKKEGFIAYMKIDENFDDFAHKISTAFGLPYVKCVKAHERIKTVALTTGSGASLMRSIDAECFLTGDIKYHDAMEAKTINLSMIDIGHYESEQFFGKILATYLENLGLAVIISQSKNPFTYI